MRIMESGIRRRNFAKLYTMKPICVNRQNFQSISIDDALPAMLLIPYGIVFAFAAVFIEKLLSLLHIRQELVLRI